MTEQLAWKRWLQTRHTDAPDKRAEDFLLEQYRPLAQRLAARAQREYCTMELEDYEAVAMASLSHALNTYQPGRSRFMTWAYPQIRGGIEHAMRKTDVVGMQYRRNVRLLAKARAALELERGPAEALPASLPEIAARAGIGLGSALATVNAPYAVPLSSPLSDAADYGDRYNQSILGETSPTLGDPLALLLAGCPSLGGIELSADDLSAALDRLPNQSRDFLVRRYCQEETVASIARTYAVNPSYVRHRCRIALARLRALLAPALPATSPTLPRKATHENFLAV